MNTGIRRTFFAALLVAVCAAAASADIKIKSKSSFGGGQGQTAESTTYIKGKRQRSESPGGMASIMQCDLRRNVQLNSSNKTYMVSPFDGGADAQPGATTAPAQGGAAEPVRTGGVVTTTMTITDTGERKQMFGYTARRIKTSMVTESSPDACNKTKSRFDSDGWYIDLAVAFDCYDSAATAYTRQSASGGCRDQYRTKRVGTAKMGHPVQVTTTIYDEAGNPSMTMTQEVVEISQATLDAALFDVPADYRLVKDAAEMYAPPGAAGGVPQDDDDADNDGDAGSPSTTGGSAGVGGPANAGASSAAALGPKRAGVVRIGVAMPTASADEGVSPEGLAQAVRGALVGRLVGPSVEAVPLDARAPAQADSEAREKECDYVVFATVAHKKGGSGGGGFGGFLKKAAPVVAGTAPYGGGTAGAVARQGVYTADDVAEGIKSRDEMTLDYRLQSLNAASAPFARQLKAKAKSDREDLVSNLAGQAASAVLAEAGKK
jgi:hypothetical protein